MMLVFSACRDSKAKFEPTPRNVLEALGIKNSRDPKIAVSSSGLLSMLAVYQDGAISRLGFTMSHNGGDEFMPLVAISEAGAFVQSHGENSPSLAITPTVTYALWEQSTGDTSDLMLGRSLNFGHSFEKPVRVNDNVKTSFHGFASLAASADGTVIVAWLDGRNPDDNPGTFSVYVARSGGKGATFGPNTRIGTSACPCCRPRVLIGENGVVHIAWRKDFPGDVRDIVVSTSRDGGRTFGPEVRVSDDGWVLKGCPDSGPSIALLKNRLYVAWLTEGREQKPRLQLSWSDDQARTFVHPLNVSGDTVDPNHPSLAVSEDGNMVITFQGRASKRASDWTPNAVFTVGIKGQRTTRPIELRGKGSASYPAIVLGTAGRTFVAWTDTTNDGSAVSLIRGRLH